MGVAPSGSRLRTQFCRCSPPVVCRAVDDGDWEIEVVDYGVVEFGMEERKLQECLRRR